MNPGPARRVVDPAEEIPALIETLLATEQRLEELTGGEVDTVSSGSGQPFLLRRAQQEMRNSDAAKQAAILNALPAHIALLDAQGRIVSVNESWRRFAGANDFLGPEAGLGRNYLEICDRARGEDSAEAGGAAAGIRSVLDGRAPEFSLEYSCHSPMEPRWFSMTVTPMSSDRTGGAVVMHLNITEQKQAEDALRASNEMFHQLADNISDAFWIRSPDLGEVQYVSPAFERIWGRTVGSLYANPEQWAEFIFPEDRERVQVAFAALTGDTPSLDIDYRIVRPGGEVRWVRVRGFQIRDETDRLIRHAGIVTDITERRRLDEHVLQAQKMEALGQFSGGVAHDFNNILATISGSAELSRLTLQGNPEVRRHLDTVLAAAQRAADLVRQILTFSRQETPEREALDLLPVVAESLKLMRAVIPETIEFGALVATDAPAVLANANQIHQVLMNLGVNAWHAMKDRPGRLDVKLERCVVDDALAARQSRLRRGLYARVSFSDTGSGMDPATLRRIFEPFFTTKPPGEGTGLGLAVVHGIMDSHDGAVVVESTPGQGTEFQLYFPAHTGAARTTVEAKVSVPRGQGERILVVDDEQAVTEIIELILETLGYEVEHASLAETAIAMVRADPLRHALVLTDQTMPGMTGTTLAAQLQLIRPGLPIILMTGYSAVLTPEKVRALGIRQLLHKPASYEAIGAAVHAALSPRASEQLQPEREPGYTP
jgi:PAS domain S-box-containing protein